MTGNFVEQSDDIVHIGHVELFTPVLEESLNFFYESMGLEIVKRTDERAYLRCWNDYEQYSPVSYTHLTLPTMAVV